jgi:4-amino-4-deoxy-L-arabinose transferase-like glycosyltransferase
LRNCLYALCFAALAIAARLPFLVTGKIPFDSDEAVEGLMARHVLAGEFPAFFWGQAFKGVPEVYAAAGAFAVLGSGVAVLKSVTLMCFAAYVTLNFVLLSTISSRLLAVAASLLLVFSPPALVFWSLDASAEYIIIMLLGTILLLLGLRLEEAAGARNAEHRAGKRLLFAAGVVTGLGLWVHQLFIVYLFPIALIFTLRSQSWRRQTVGRQSRLAPAVAAIAVIYVALGLVAFLTGGFSLRLGPLSVSATAPQKMLRIAVGLAGLALAIHLTRRPTRTQVRAWISRCWPAALGFFIGYLPVLLYSIMVEPARSPARNANFRQLASAAPDILGNVVPILGGFKIATTERLPIPLIAAAPGLAALAAYIWSHRARLGRVFTLRAHDATLATDFFPVFMVFVPMLFLVSGAYVDTQSYRYLIPWYAGLSIAWPAGSLIVAGHRRGAGIMIAGAILAVHVWQQVTWYQKLAPDTQSIATIDCLRRLGVKGGFAEYWTSYKLTFLANEQLIVAPTDGVDRYPKYTELVRTLPSHLRLDNVTHCK